MKILAEDDTNTPPPETQPIPSMNNIQRLPILLVSAKDQDAVSVITSEIINTCQDDSPHKIMQSEQEYVWKITNKYYTANIRVHALQDGEVLDSQLADSVEAHLIYLTEDECDEETAVEVVRRRGEACASCAVQLVAAAAGAEPPRLAAACVRARRELVALRERDERDELDERGVGRLRAALHAHLWPGLRRETHSDPRVPDDEEASDSSDSWSEWCTGPAGEEAYFAALASLPGAAAAARLSSVDGAADREGRLARAEQLVAAFCRALGEPVE